MKNLLMITIAILLYSCGTKSPSTMLYKNVTPKAYHVSQSEKDDVNFDLRENRKLISKNVKHKEQNQKQAAKRLENMQKDLNELNANTTKVKKKSYNMEAFNFYH